MRYVLRKGEVIARGNVRRLEGLRCFLHIVEVWKVALGLEFTSFGVLWYKTLIIQTKSTHTKQNWLLLHRTSNVDYLCEDLIERQ